LNVIGSSSRLASPSFHAPYPQWRSCQGHIWGQKIPDILSLLSSSSCNGEGGEKFDLIILSDLIFNHSQHDALLKTCTECLSLSSSSLSSSPSITATSTSSSLASHPPSASTQPQVEPTILVFYSHHRPHLASRDLEFFDKARGEGWSCEEAVIARFPVCVCLCIN
jgi:EEF1A N-terminal glycine/lysine methyltransferase